MFWALRKKMADFILNPAGRVGPARLTGRDLSGDREVEWTFAATRIGKYVKATDRVLDFGCGTGMISLSAVGVGAEVLAIDLLDCRFSWTGPRMSFRRQDVMGLSEKAAFDVIVHVSVIEHVGLSGRYGSEEENVGDFQAMKHLRSLLKPRGVMILTLPVGRDQVVRPFHRIYGRERLPRLLDGYEVVEEAYWRKADDNVWRGCSKDEACEEQGDARYYALGTLVLRAE